MSAFWAQPEGTGPFFPMTMLRLAYVHQVHGARCVLSWEKMASVAAIGWLFTRPGSDRLLAREIGRDTDFSIIV